MVYCLKFIDARIFLISTKLTKTLFFLLWDFNSTGKKKCARWIWIFWWNAATLVLNAWIFNNAIFNPIAMLSGYVVPKQSWEILRFSKDKLINYSVTSNNIKAIEVLKILINFPLTILKLYNVSVQVKQCTNIKAKSKILYTNYCTTSKLGQYESGT